MNINNKSSYLKMAQNNNLNRQTRKPKNKNKGKNETKGNKIAHGTTCGPYGNNLLNYY